MNAINIDRRINYDSAHAQYVATMGISITFLGCHGAALKEFITTEKHFQEAISKHSKLKAIARYQYILHTCKQPLV